MLGATPGIAATRRSTGLPWVVLGLAAAALLALAVWGASPYARYLDHGHQPNSAGGQAGAIALFLTGWALMILGTMLPTVTSLLRSVALLGTDPAAQRRLQVLVAVGFVAVWLGVGYTFRAADSLVHTGVDAWSWLGDRPHLVAAGTLLVAGGFQLSPLKHRCLTACRTPTSFLHRHWHGERPRQDALRIGAAYGASCVGCCWALMLVMFGLGTGSLAWMLGIAAFVAVEKNTHVGPRLSMPLGVGLLAAGAWVAV